MVNQKQWGDYSYIIRGKQKVKVIKIMEKPMTVTEIKKATELSLSEASRVVRGFAKIGLAKCLNPDDVIGRVYELTQRGKSIKLKIANS